MHSYCKRTLAPLWKRRISTADITDYSPTDASARPDLPAAHLPPDRRALSALEPRRHEDDDLNDCERTAIRVTEWLYNTDEPGCARPFREHNQSLPTVADIAGPLFMFEPDPQLPRQLSASDRPANSDFVVPPNLTGVSPKSPHVSISTLDYLAAVAPCHVPLPRFPGPPFLWHYPPLETWRDICDETRRLCRMLNLPCALDL